MDPSAVISSLYDCFKDGVPLQNILSQINNKTSHFDPVKFEGDEKQQELGRKQLKSYAERLNKAMTEYNPDNRYTSEEMIFLHDVRAARKRNEGMHFAVFGHAMDILDVELKGGRWYMLVRDTNNIRNYGYEKNSKGRLVGTAGKSSFEIKDGVRRLDGSMTTGFRGTSWWELDTIFDKMYSYGNAPKL